MSAPVLEALGLVRSYGRRRVVDGVDLAVHAGEVHGLLGPNGAGKTTTFRLLTGVELPDAGEVRLDGRPLGRAPLHERARRGLGYLPQEDTLLADLDVAGNVSLALDAVGSREAPEVLLARVGLAGFGARAVGGLSGGERRRLAVARLLALSPRVLLLDEPFAGVDPIAVAGISALVRALAEAGAAVLVTDHAVRETLAVCDRATLLDGGRVLVTGTPAEVAADPRARDRYLGADWQPAPGAPARSPGSPP